MSDHQTPQTALVKELREEARADYGQEPWPCVLLERAADAIEKLQAAADQERARWPATVLGVRVKDNDELNEIVAAAIEAGVYQERLYQERARLQASIGACSNGYAHYCPNCDRSFGGPPAESR